MEMTGFCALSLRIMQPCLTWRKALLSRRPDHEPTYKVLDLRIPDLAQKHPVSTRLWNRPSHLLDSNSQTKESESKLQLSPDHGSKTASKDARSASPPSPIDLDHVQRSPSSTPPGATRNSGSRPNYILGINHSKRYNLHIPPFHRTNKFLPPRNTLLFPHLPHLPLPPPHPSPPRPAPRRPQKRHRRRNRQTTPAQRPITGKSAQVPFRWRGSWCGACFDSEECVYLEAGTSCFCGVWSFCDAEEGSEELDVGVEGGK